MNATFNKDTSPRFAEAVQRGYELEKRVLNGDFDPLPDFNVKRLVMDVAFACADDATEAKSTDAPLLLPTPPPSAGPSATPTALVTVAPRIPYTPPTFTPAPIAPAVTLPPDILNAPADSLPPTAALCTSPRPTARVVPALQA